MVAKDGKEYRGFIFILEEIAQAKAAKVGKGVICNFAPHSRDTSPHGRDALSRALTWILDWGPYYAQSR